MSVEKIEGLRKRHSSVNEQLIGYRARYEDVSKRVEQKAKELKDRYGVSSLNELRQLASKKKAERDRLLDEAERTIVSGEQILRQVKTDLDKQQAG